MNADGTAPQRLTNNGVMDLAPTWSPDGTLIAFGRDVTGGHRWEVFVMEATGANLRRVTYSPPDRTAINPDWQPKTALVPLYLQSLRLVRTGESVKLTWDVTDGAAAVDFRVVAAQGGVQRDVPVVATGSWRFEAVDVVAGSLGSGTITYRLYLRSRAGEWALIGEESVLLGSPHGRARISGVHPNPSNPSTTISFVISEPQPVKLEIHDSAGRRIAVLVDEVRAAGVHGLSWDGRDTLGRRVAAGVYLVRLATRNNVDVRKMVLVQ
jgi:hypothetical protein